MPDAAQTVPLFGFGVGVKSSNVSAQMRTNVYCEVAPDDDKTHIAYYARPGLRKVAQSLGGVGPITGALPLQGVGTYFGVNISNGPAALFFTAGSVVGIDPSGAITTTGALTGNTGARTRAAMLAVSPNFSIINATAVAVDGVNAWWLGVSPGGAVFTQALGTGTSADFPLGSSSVAGCASRFVAIDPAYPGRFRWSAVGDGTTWSALDFATADQSPDPLVAIFEAWGELLLFGSQSIEFWSVYSGGASGQQPFIRIPGATLQWGTQSVDTICKTGDTVTFLGSSNGGNAQVVQLRGYQAQVISNPEIETAIAADGNAADATAFFCIAAGHQFYVLNLASASWAYDLTTGTWARWQTEGARFAGQFVATMNEALCISDYRDERVYVLDPAVMTDDGATMTRQIVSKHAWANLARLSLRELAIDCETGVGLDGSVQGSAPQLMLQWSKDGGHTWGNEVWLSLGQVGGYLTRAVVRGLGRARDWVFRLTVTDPVKVVVIGAAAIFSP